MTARAPYNGSKRKLVLAFDIGTTYSGISYCILDPGQVPTIQGVTKFPGQEEIKGASKIPTVIYYDQQGNVQAVGAETQTDDIYTNALENGWFKAEWFKLHIRSKHTPGGLSTHDTTIKSSLPPLPPNKTPLQVLTDFLRYLFACASAFIRETHLNGDQLWRTLSSKKDIYYVLTHPNGWEGMEQGVMRTAAVDAGLVSSEEDGERRVVLVSEGEASLHFAIWRGLGSDKLQKGRGVIVVDAGGGTIDMSTYRKAQSAGKLAFEEIIPAQCHFRGSVFVTLSAQIFLKNVLQGSPFLSSLDHISRCFDTTTKLRFRPTTDDLSTNPSSSSSSAAASVTQQLPTQTIRFGTPQDNDPRCGIRFGQIKIDGVDVASFFEPSVECVVDGVKGIKKVAGKGKVSVTHVVLVGGFAASDWLYQNVKSRLAKESVNVIRPDTSVNKAVSDGAVSFYIDHYVSTRITKMAYGVLHHIPYSRLSPDHFRRRHKVITNISGERRLPGVFSTVLERFTKVREEVESRINLEREGLEVEEFGRFEEVVWCYRGMREDPQWVDVEPDMYSKLCTIKADLSKYPAKPRKTPSGVTYYKLKYDVILLFGLTELKAMVAWKEDGVEKRSPAKIIYDPEPDDQPDDVTTTVQDTVPDPQRKSAQDLVPLTSLQASNSSESSEQLDVRLMDGLA